MTVILNKCISTLFSVSKLFFLEVLERSSLIALSVLIVLSRGPVGSEDHLLLIDITLSKLD